MSEWLNRSLTFDEAVAWAKQREVVLPDEYYGNRIGIARAQAFSVAGLASIDQLEAVKAALDDYLMQGKPFGNFVNDVKDGIIPIDLPKSRLDNIFRTNIQGAYNAGRYAAQQEFKDTRPYLMYDAINDSRTRPSHRAMDNIIKPIDDPFWNTHYPPNGYRCRCHVRSLSIEQAEKKGGSTLNVPANAKPDVGWDYNGGKDIGEGIKRAVEQKLERCKQLGFSVDSDNCNKTAYSLLVQMREKLDTIETMKMEKHINNEQGRDYSIARTEWRSRDDAHIYADIEAVKTHANYEAAKSGSFDDSVLLARHFMNQKIIDRIKSAYHNPILLPVMAEEKMGKNAIPLGMANVIKEETGWRVSDSIVQTNKAGHTGATGWHRITVPALFMGDVIQGENYLIIDDFIGMGGTAANIKSFIENSGAQVVGYEILTGLPESSKLYLRNETLEALRNKYGSLEQWFKQTVGFGYEGLTESEASYLLRAKSPERIRNQITRAIHEGISGKN